MDAYDRDRPCRKCGGHGATATYKVERSQNAIRDEREHLGYRTETRVWNERLERCCTICGYTWDETVLNPEKTE